MTFKAPVRTHVEQVGRELLRALRALPSLPMSSALDQQLMQVSFAHPEFKNGLFQFVDVLPALGKADEVREHFREYVLPNGNSLPIWMRGIMHLGVSLPLMSTLFSSLIRSNVSRLATSFIAGADVQDGLNDLASRWQEGTAFTADLLGEAVVSPQEACAVRQRYITLIHELHEAVQAWPERSLLEWADGKKIPRVNVSVKPSSLVHRLSALDFDRSVDRLCVGLEPVLAQAVKVGAFVNLDMEQHDFREMILRAAEVLFGENFATYLHLGIVCQSYLKCARADLLRLSQLAQKRGAPITVRLVKGAYWDFEVVRARQRGWPVPVFEDKYLTDQNFERCADDLIRAAPYLRPAFASHNVKSLAYVLALAEVNHLPSDAFEIQLLHGMADALGKVLRERGVRVRIYAPFGPLLPGMAYLVRRLLENTSNQGFLAGMNLQGQSDDDLLRDPHEF